MLPALEQKLKHLSRLSMQEVCFVNGRLKGDQKTFQPVGGVRHLISLSCNTANVGVNMALSCCKVKISKYWADRRGCADSVTCGPALG